jgi:hypothetical protein
MVFSRCAWAASDDIVLRAAAAAATIFMAFGDLLRAAHRLNAVADFFLSTAGDR